MKKFGVCKILSICTFSALLFLIPLSAYADTVTLTSVDGYGPWSGPAKTGANVYPYSFSVNNSTSTISLMCLSFASDIFPGESWQATIVSAAGNTGYEEAAYIFSQIGTYGAVDTQWANWELFDSNPTDSVLVDAISSLSSADQANISNLLTDAANYVAANPDSPLYNEYVIYLPTAGSQVPYADGTPQILIGSAPEPSSFILLGSGLLGLVVFLFGKKRNGLNTRSVGA